MAKKRRTELDIDPSLGAPKEEEVAPPPPPPPAEEPPPGPETPGEPPPGPKINKVKLAIIGGVAVVLLGVTTTIGMVTYNWLYPEVIEEPAKPVEVKKKKKKPKKKKAVKKAVVAHLYQFSPFIIRAGKGKDVTLVRIDFAVEMDGPGVRKEIERNIVLIRENIFFLLNEQTLKTFRNEQMRRKMAIDVAIILNRSIQSGAIIKTLITGLTVY